MGSFSLNGVFTACPDPDYEGVGPPEVGAFLGGKPIRQGWETGTLKFPVLQSAMYNELYSRWSANCSVHTSGALPKNSGYGWDAVSAWYHEPRPTGWDGPNAAGVTMGVTRVIRY
jgi:hypothetical protein